MAVPAHRRRRSPYARQVLGVRLRPDEQLALVPWRRYLLGEIRAGNVVWSPRTVTQRPFWRCDGVNVSVTVAQVVRARWVQVSGSEKSRTRSIVLTDEGIRLLGVA